MVNPVVNGANAFIAIWQSLPMPLTSVFYVALVLAVVWFLFKLLTR